MTTWNTLPVSLTEDRLMIGNHQVMQRWEEPVMWTMADGVSDYGDVLEIGYGMGILAEMIDEKCYPTSRYSEHTIIEPHPMIVRDAQEWAGYSPVPRKIIPAFWQDVYDTLPRAHYSAIFFDIFTPPDDPNALDLPDMIRKMYPLLRPGGILTWYSGVAHGFPVTQLSVMLELFSEVTLKKVEVEPYPDTDYFRGKQMIVPFAKK